MFEFIRTHTRLALGFMLLLIIPSFVFFGVQGYSQFNDAGNDTVAKVDGQSITRAEWDSGHQRYLDQLRRQSPDLANLPVDTPESRRATLDNLVRERVLLAAANKQHLFPTNERMARLFDSDPQYAGLRGPDGRISRELLVAQGLTPALFDQRLRQELGLKQVLAGVLQTAPASATPAKAALDAFFERRAVQLQRFDPAAYRDRVKPGDAEIEAYYKANEAQFRAPEQADIEYVTLDLDMLGKAVTQSEEQLRKAYTEGIARYSVAEERRASHILVKAEAGAPAAERRAARAKAEALLAEVRKTPSAFAELARKNSDDSGSAAQGGDLDFFGRGQMVKAFEDSAFSLKAGEISGIVESDFGFHIITLTGVRGGQTRPFEEVRGEVEAEARKAAAQKRWAEAAESFSNTVYEQSDSLQPVIDKLKLTKQTATVQRTAAPGATGALASAKLLAAVFSTDAVKDKRNTDAVEVGPNGLAAARVVRHAPARSLPLAEVKDKVRARLVDEQSAALARTEGQARVKALQAGGSTEALPIVVTVSRAQAQGMPRPLMDAALRADAGKLPVVTGVDLGADGFFVMRVMQVLPREQPPGGEEPLRAQYAQAWANAEAEAYLGALKKRHKAVVTAAADAPVAAATPER
ncbi:MAG: peptidylprolyl isomerase [Leptothrix sp. (in: Bacteria)]|nr:peptidylprolyl isomerase [Leptothrix sp. (in: b-proteobacteria)]